ncbi:MAG: ATP-binding cassette domain-containing protein [Bacilli bacterium]
MGYLPQTIAPIGGQTVHSFLDDAQRDLLSMAAQLEDLAALMGMVPAESLDRIMGEYGELAARFEQRGGYELAYRRETVRDGLGLADINVMRPVSSLSGGEKTRLGLAALLVGAPDLLLLDEPTNHLDVAMLEWLEDYLRAFSGALLVVSHDRSFSIRQSALSWRSMNTIIACVRMPATTTTISTINASSDGSGTSVSRSSRKKFTHCSDASMRRRIRWVTIGHPEITTRWRIIVTEQKFRRWSHAISGPLRFCWTEYWLIQCRDRPTRFDSRRIFPGNACTVRWRWRCLECLKRATAIGASCGG